MAIDIEKKANDFADKTASRYQKSLAEALERFETMYHDFFIAGTRGSDYARLYNDLDVNEIINGIMSLAYDTGKGEYDED